MFSVPTQRKAPALFTYKVAPTGTLPGRIEPVANLPRRRVAPAIVISVLAHAAGVIALAAITFHVVTPRVVPLEFKSVPLVGVITPDGDGGGKPDAGGGSGTGNSATQPAAPVRLAAMGPVVVVEDVLGISFPARDEFFTQIRADAGAPGGIGFAGAGWGSGTGNGAGDGTSDGVQGAGGDGHAGYLHCPKPDYPRLARQQGWQGTTLLRVEVRVNGVPGTVEVAASSGYEVLDNAALKAVHSWKFQPGHLGDQLVACWVEVPVRFALR